MEFNFKSNLSWVLWALWVPAFSGLAACSDEDTAEEGAPRVVNAPGECFEVFGPPGIGHSPPRSHDFGVVEVGDSRVASVSFHNFCFDTESVVVGTTVLDQGSLSPSADFEITSSPAPGSSISLEAELVEVTFSPTAPGLHRATIRYQVSHGYYDFDLVAEAVDPM